jgi:hypothetical protein
MPGGRKMHRYHRLKMSYGFSLLLAATLLFSCASIPVGKYEALNDSSRQILAGTTDTYTRIEKLQRYFAVVTAPNEPITADFFKPEVDGQSFDITPELRFRETALEVMVKYTTFLSALSSKDYQSDVDKASQDLAGSLKNLVSSVSDTADAAKASGIAATLVNVISKQVIEHRRADALRKAMDMAQDDITGLSNLIIGSNKKITDFVLLMQGRIIAHANAARPAYGSADRITFDSNIAVLLAEIADVNASLDSVSSAIAKIPGAHKEVRAALDKKPTTLEALQSLVQEAQRANKFYRNLGQ